MMSKYAAFAGLLVLWPSAVFADVRVNFIDPDHYTDANLYRNLGGRSAKEPAMREIEKTLRRLGDTYLHPGETLSVDVLDIDLAGRFEPWHFEAHDVRFMREITWPSIRLKYSLESSTRPQSGEETVSDKSYLMSLVNRDSTKIMPYEKLMLQRWFRTHFDQRPAR